MKSIVVVALLINLLAAAQTVSLSKDQEFLSFVDSTNRLLEKQYKVTTTFVPTEGTIIDRITMLFKEKEEFMDLKTHESTVKEVFYSQNPMTEVNKHLPALKLYLQELKEVMDKSDHLLKKNKAIGVGFDYYRKLRTDIIRAYALRVYVDIAEKNDSRLKADLASFFNFIKTYEVESNNLISNVIFYMQISNLVKEVSVTKITPSQKVILKAFFASNLKPILDRDEREVLKNDFINSYFSSTYTYWSDFTKTPNPKFKDILAIIASDDIDPELKILDTLPAYFKKNPSEGSIGHILIPILLNENLPIIRLKTNPAIRDFITELKSVELLDGSQYRNSLGELRNQIRSQLWRDLGEKEEVLLDKYLAGEEALVKKLISDKEFRLKCKEAVLKSDYLFHYLYFMIQDKIDPEFSYSYNKILGKKYITEQRLKKFMK